MPQGWNIPHAVDRGRPDNLVVPDPSVGLSGHFLATGSGGHGGASSRSSPRSSYVIWQEGISPFVVVELLSPGTEKEDLGQNAESASNPILEAGQPELETPPRKWDVYEKILRIPYYVVFSRYTNQMRVFQLVGSDYQEQPIAPDRPRFWFDGLKLGLGLWQGEFDGITRSWLRWYDAQNNWLLTDAERAEQEQQRAEQAEAQLQQVALNLLQSGLSIEQVAQLTGFSEERVRNIGSI